VCVYLSRLYDAQYGGVVKKYGLERKKKTLKSNRPAAVGVYALMDMKGDGGEDPKKSAATEYRSYYTSSYSNNNRSPPVEGICTVFDTRFKFFRTGR
jgi:hypothetical protein